MSKAAQLLDSCVKEGTQLTAVLDCYNKMLSTEVITAVTKGDVQNLENLLAENGQIVRYHDRRRKTALYYAAQSRHLAAPECIRLLLISKANVDAAARNGRTAALCVCETGNLRSFDILHEHGASFFQTDRDGMSPLHAAAKWGHTAMMKKLLDLPVDANARNSAGWTPMHFAARNNNVDAVKTLIDYKADLTALNEEKQSAVFLAHQEGHRGVVEAIMTKTKGNLKLGGKNMLVESIDAMLLTVDPKEEVKQMDVIRKMGESDLVVPERKSYRVRTKHRLADLTPRQLAALLEARNLQMFSAPFLAGGVGGAELQNMQIHVYAGFFETVKTEYKKTHRHPLQEQQFHAVLWGRLQQMVTDVVENKGVDDDELKRSVTRHSIRDMDRFEDVFRTLDTDGSGSLCVSELLPMLDLFSGTGPGQKITLPIAKQALAEADVDGDETISLEEFKELFNKMRTTQLARDNVVLRSIQAKGHKRHLKLRKVSASRVRLGGAGKEMVSDNKPEQKSALPRLQRGKSTTRKNKNRIAHHRLTHHASALTFECGKDESPNPGAATAESDGTSGAENTPASGSTRVFKSRGISMQEVVIDQTLHKPQRRVVQPRKALSPLSARSRSAGSQRGSRR